MARMTRMIRFIALGLMLSSPVGAETLNVEQEAVSVVQRYLDALPQGDTDTLKSLMGGRLLTQSQRQLDDAEYATFLQSLYEHTRFEISSSRPLDPDTVVVDVKVLQHGSDERLTHFVVQREASQSQTVGFLRIIDEQGK